MWKFILSVLVCSNISYAQTTTPINTTIAALGPDGTFHFIASDINGNLATGASSSTASPTIANYVQPMALVGLGPNGYTYIKTDINGNLMVTGGSGGGGTIPNTSDLLIGGPNNTAIDSGLSVNGGVSVIKAATINKPCSTTTDWNGDGSGIGPSAGTSARTLSWGCTTSTLGGYNLLLLSSDGSLADFAEIIDPASGNLGFYCGNAGTFVACSSVISSTGLNTPKLFTTSNCSSSASPAVCGSASSGSFSVAAGTNSTIVVATTAVTANSQIILTIDDTLGTKLGVTCNSTIQQTTPIVSARTSGVSFTATVVGVFTTNPVCLSYAIIN